MERAPCLRTMSLKLHPLLLCLALAFTAPFLLCAGGAGFRIFSKGKYAASVVGTNPELGEHCMPMNNGTWEPCVYKYGCRMGI